MRKCLCSKRSYDAQSKSWVKEPPIECVFHDFSKETTEDGYIITVAIIEFTDGSLDTVSISDIKLLEAKQSFDYRRVEDHLIWAIDECVHHFIQMTNRH